MSIVKRMIQDLCPFTQSLVRRGGQIKKGLVSMLSINKCIQISMNFQLICLFRCGHRGDPYFGPIIGKWGRQACLCKNGGDAFQNHPATYHQMERFHAGSKGRVSRNSAWENNKGSHLVSISRTGCDKRTQWAKQVNRKVRMGEKCKSNLRVSGQRDG